MAAPKHTEDELEAAFERERVVYNKFLRWVNTLGFPDIRVVYKTQGQVYHAGRTVLQPQFGRASTYEVLPYAMPGLSPDNNVFLNLPKYQVSTALQSDLTIKIVITRNGSPVIEGTGTGSIRSGTS
jgi:hypothetical protein